MVKGSVANRKIKGSNPPANPQGKDQVICSHKYYSLVNSMAQFYSSQGVAISRNRLGSTQQQHSWLYMQTQPCSISLLFSCTGSFQHQLHTSTVTYVQLNTNIHPQIHLHINQVIHSHTHTNVHGHKHSHTVIHTHSHRATHIAPNTSRAHFISNCEQMLLVFINLQTLCLPVSLAPPLPLPYSLFLLGGR